MRKTLSLIQAQLIMCSDPTFFVRRLPVSREPDGSLDKNEAEHKWSNLNGGNNMAPVFRTCCGFLQIQTAYRVSYPQLCLRSGLNAGSRYSYRWSALQVKEVMHALLIVTKSNNIWNDLRPVWNMLDHCNQMYYNSAKTVVYPLRCWLKYRVNKRLKHSDEL